MDGHLFSSNIVKTHTTSLEIVRRTGNSFSLVLVWIVLQKILGIYSKERREVWLGLKSTCP